MRRNRFFGKRRSAVIGAALGLMVAGCKTSYHRKAADKEAYGIIEQAEKDVFGKNRPFTIDTPYSDRKPEEILAMDLISERQQPGELFLKVEDTLQLAVSNSREYQSRKEQLYLSALSLSGERYAFGPQFLASSSISGDRTSNGENVASGNSRFSVNQALKAGGSISATIANDFLRYYTGDPRKSVVSSLSVNLVQPLLRGAGKNIAAENLKQAERNVIYAIRTFSQYQRQFAADIVLDFFQLLQNKDQLRNAYDDYQRRLDTIRYTEARGEAGVQSQLDVDEAKTEELTAKNSYITTATSYLNNLDAFKITMGLPLTTNLRLDDSSMERLVESGLTSLNLDPDLAFRTAIEQHLELLNEIDRFEDSKRKVKVSADRLKADLNILADASLDSERPTDYTSFDFDDVRVGAGIQLNLPIDRLRERNNYRAALVSFESEIRSLSLQLDQKKDQIGRGLRDLERLRRSYDIQKSSVEIAKRRVEGEQLSLLAGRRTVLNVREAQDSLIRAQNDLTAALIGHLGAKLQLLVNIGVLDTDMDNFWSNPKAVNIPLEQNQEPSEVPSQPDEIKPPDQIFGI
ncbi:MAG: TolC family protein [Verrucomicrobia bacterium]|nr:TolC family protein [Verrucomicrobiota bacterium]